MSSLYPPLPVKPILALFGAETERLNRAAAWWSTLVGPIDYVSPFFAFDQTTYYQAEMGDLLVKRLVAAEQLMDPTDLVRIKVETVAYEQTQAMDGKRAVNLDPGYISAERLVLATGKNAAHRIYLGQGVWGDLTLVFQSGGFLSLPWTYPDYAGQAFQASLLDIRQRYLYQLKTKNSS
ncbi:MAG: DUF4416 family protein [Deltaproteobacteria bacterium]|nr:DUF4416 family protein [Deltaproteobacteria bacterium]